MNQSGLVVRATLAGAVGGAIATAVLAVLGVALVARFVPKMMPRMMGRMMAEGGHAEQMRACMERFGCLHPDEERAS